MAESIDYELISVLMGLPVDEIKEGMAYAKEAIARGPEFTETEAEADRQARSSRGHVLRVRIADGHGGWEYGDAIADTVAGGYQVIWDDGDNDDTPFYENVGQYSIQLRETVPGGTW